MSDLTPKKPEIDEARIQRIYDELKTLHETLDPDPLALGPKRMNNKVAKVRNMLKRCVDIELQLSEDLHWFNRSLNREQGNFELEFQALIANDPHVRAGRSAADREAAAKVKLHERVREIQRLQENAQDLESLLTVVKTKAKDIRDIQGRLKDQMKICEHELGLGAKWGSAQPHTYDDSKATSADTELIDGLLNDVDDQVPEPEEGAQEEPSENESSNGEADDFLADLAAVSKDPAPEPKKPRPEEVDVDALLASLNEESP